MNNLIYITRQDEPGKWAGRCDAAYLGWHGQYEGCDIHDVYRGGVKVELDVLPLPIFENKTLKLRVSLSVFGNRIGFINGTDLCLHRVKSISKRDNIKFYEVNLISYVENLKELNLNTNKFNINNCNFKLVSEHHIDTNVFDLSNSYQRNDGIELLKDISKLFGNDFTDELKVLESDFSVDNIFLYFNRDKIWERSRELKTKCLMEMAEDIPVDDYVPGTVVYDYSHNLEKEDSKVKFLNKYLENKKQNLKEYNILDHHRIVEEGLKKYRIKQRIVKNYIQTRISLMYKYLTEEKYERIKDCSDDTFKILLKSHDKKLPVVFEEIEVIKNIINTLGLKEWNPSE